jgi:hypothetical protein
MEEVLSPAEIERIRKRGRRLRNVDYDVPLMEEVLSPDEIERIRRNYPHVPPVVPPYVQPNVDQEMPPPVPDQEMPAAEVPWEENRAFFDDFVVRNRDVVGDGQFFYNQTDIWGQNILSRYPELIESMDRMTIIDKRNTADLIAQHANAAMNLLNDWRTAPSSIDPMWDRIEQMLLNVVNQMNLFRDQALLEATQSHEDQLAQRAREDQLAQEAMANVNRLVAESNVADARRTQHQQARQDRFDAEIRRNMEDRLARHDRIVEQDRIAREAEQNRLPPDYQYLFANDPILSQARRERLAEEDDFRQWQRNNILREQEQEPRYNPGQFQSQRNRALDVSMRPNPKHLVIDRK